MKYSKILVTIRIVLKNNDYYYIDGLYIGIVFIYFFQKENSALLEILKLLILLKN